MPVMMCLTNIAKKSCLAHRPHDPEALCSLSLRYQLPQQQEGGAGSDAVSTLGSGGVHWAAMCAV